MTLERNVVKQDDFIISPEFVKRPRQVQSRVFAIALGILVAKHRAHSCGRVRAVPLGRDGHRPSGSGYGVLPPPRRAHPPWDRARPARHHSGMLANHASSIANVGGYTDRLGSLYFGHDYNIPNTALWSGALSAQYYTHTPSVLILKPAMPRLVHY